MYRSFLFLISLAAPLFSQPPSVAAFGYTAQGLTAVAPGQVLTLYVQGLNARLDTPSLAPGLPLPTTLAGVSVVLRQSIDGYANPIPVPILSVVRTPACGNGSNDLQKRYAVLCAIRVTIQVPFELAPSCPLCGSLIATSLRAALIVSEGGVEGTPIAVLPLADQVHVVDPCDVMFVGRQGSPTLLCGPAITHADGTQISRGNPAKQGEAVTMYVLGLGLTAPPSRTGQRSGQADAVNPERFRLGATFEINTQAKPIVNPVTGETLPGQFPVKIDYVGIVEGYVGLYQVNFTIPVLPGDSPSCGPGSPRESNVGISFGTASGYSGGGICVAR